MAGFGSYAKPYVENPFAGRIVELHLPSAKRYTIFGVWELTSPPVPPGTPGLTAFAGRPNLNYWGQIILTQTGASGYMALAPYVTLDRGVFSFVPPSSLVTRYSGSGFRIAVDPVSLTPNFVDGLQFDPTVAVGFSLADVPAAKEIDLNLIGGGSASASIAIPPPFGPVFAYGFYQSPLGTGPSYSMTGTWAASLDYDEPTSP